MGGWGYLFSPENGERSFGEKLLHCHEYGPDVRIGMCPQSLRVFGMVPGGHAVIERGTPQRDPIEMKTSAGSLKRALNLLTCSKVSLRLPARNIDTALSDPN